MENDFLLKRPHRRLQLLRSGCKDRSNCYVDPALVSQMLYLEVVVHPHCSCGDKETAAVRGVTRREVDLFFSLINDLPQARRCIGELAWAIGVRFRLPTEAEWEYAARGGRRSKGYRYSGSDQLSQVGWFRSNSDMKTHEVGLLRANELRLHDMSGNVREWCSDWYSNGYYAECLQQGVAVDPAGPTKGASRVLRGGSHFDNPMRCRSVSRGNEWPEHRLDDVGFRLALSGIQEERK